MAGRRVVAALVVCAGAWIGSPGPAAAADVFNGRIAYDSAPAWSPDGTRIAFESNADVAGANPERDMEIWVMGADGAQLRRGNEGRRRLVAFRYRRV